MMSGTEIPSFQGAKTALDRYHDTALRNRALMSSGKKAEANTMLLGDRAAAFAKADDAFNQLIEKDE